MFSTAIITAPRPRPTLEHSLMSYREAGFFNPVHIFADGAVAPFNLYQDVWGSVLHLNASRQGNLRNWVNACRWLLQNTTSQWLVICEDDITWAANAVSPLTQELLGWSRSRTGMISLYLPRRMSKLLESVYGTSRLSSGYYGIRFGRKLWGAQCLVFAREQAEALLACGYFQNVLSDASKQINVDAHIGESMLLREMDIVYRVPCLVDHILGDNNSSIYGAKDRPDLRTSYFNEVAR